MKIVRIYNNNVVLAADDAGTEAVVIGRGLAFGRKKGHDVDPALIEQTFVPKASVRSDQIAALLSELPPEVLAVATELERMAREDFGMNISHSFIVPVADHLNFAIMRARDGLLVEYPLAIEVSQLYPRELEFGHRAVDLVAERLGARLSADEAVPLALHLVNAQFSSEDLDATFTMTEVFAQIFGIVSDAYGRPVDRSQISVARFVTHLRYLFVRSEQGKHVPAAEATLPAIHDAVRNGYPQAFDCAYKILLLLNMHLDTSLGDDEHTYLTIHIARLAADMWGNESEPATEENP